MVRFQGPEGGVRGAGGEHGVGERMAHGAGQFQVLRRAAAVAVAQVVAHILEAALVGVAVIKAALRDHGRLVVEQTGVADGVQAAGFGALDHAFGPESQVRLQGDGVAGQHHGVAGQVFEDVQGIGFQVLAFAVVGSGRQVQGRHEGGAALAPFDGFAQGAQAEVRVAHVGGQGAEITGVVGLRPGPADGVGVAPAGGRLVLRRRWVGEGGFGRRSGRGLWSRVGGLGGCGRGRVRLVALPAVLCGGACPVLFGDALGHGLRGGGHGGQRERREDQAMGQA